MTDLNHILEQAEELPGQLYIGSEAMNQDAIQENTEMRKVKD